jgi:hypothetical protein
LFRSSEATEATLSNADLWIAAHANYLPKKDIEIGSKFYLNRSRHIPIAADSRSLAFSCHPRSQPVGLEPTVFAWTLSRNRLVAVAVW